MLSVSLFGANRTPVRSITKRTISLKVRLGVCLIVGCSLSSGRDLGGYLLSDRKYAIQHEVRGREHYLSLQRVAERNERTVLRWQTLDVIRVRLRRHEFVCLGPTFRQGAHEEVVAIAVEDAEHTHIVTRAWRPDLANGKLSPTSPQGLTCDVDECDD